MDDYIDPAAYSVKHLRDAVFRGKGDLSRPLALNLLGQKTYAQKVADLERILMDPAEPPRMRTLAAASLARTRSPRVLPVLERALAVKDDIVLRTVIAGIGERGGPEAVEQLARFRRRKPGPVRDAAERASMLLRHRLDLKGGGLRSGAPGAEEPDDASIAVLPKRPAEVAEAVDHLRAVVPGLEADGAMRFRCADRTMVFLFDRDSWKAGIPRRLAAGRARLGVVAEKSTLEGTSWDVRWHLLAEAVKGEPATVQLMTGSGRVELTGRLRIEGDTIEFELGGLDEPAGLPATVTGSFESGRVRFATTRMSNRRRPALEPGRRGR